MPTVASLQIDFMINVSVLIGLVEHKRTPMGYYPVNFSIAQISSYQIWQR